MKLMKGRLILLLMLTFFCYVGQANNEAQTAQGRVLDNMTGEGIPGAKVILMTSDSVIIDSTTTLSIKAGENIGMYHFNSFCDRILTRPLEDV